MEHVDVLIVGAGLSGIGTACHLERQLPEKTYVVLESRDAVGGTWDLFRYPGIRSDSDMFTLGYRFRPWTDRKAIADGPAILSYVNDTAADYGVDRHIRFHHKVVAASWSSVDARWTVDAERSDTGETVQFTCNFLVGCSGYYHYDEPYTPEFKGRERFMGPIIHPQRWPEDLDYRGKKVVVIGSGATAVTLVPAMAPDAAHVTMLQRSPTYIISLPGEDPIANRLRKVLPPKASYAVTRFKNVVMQTVFYQLSLRRPELAKKLLRKGVEMQLPAGYDVDTHFKPRYNPWTQRLCLVPDGDLFKAISDGTVSVVTDEIESFTEKGIELVSGDELEADIIVTATGLNLVVFGGVELTVDGDKVRVPERMAYKAMMLSGVPNFAFVFGYTNASWTLKADLVSEYVCRLLAHMKGFGFDTCTPIRDPSVDEVPFTDFAAGYMKRSLHKFPKQGSSAPWRLKMNYAWDLMTLRRGTVADGTMQFTRSRGAGRRPAPEPESSAVA